jgi:hypothetical protein
MTHRAVRPVGTDDIRRAARLLAPAGVRKLGLDVLGPLPQPNELDTALDLNPERREVLGQQALRDRLI